MEFSPYLKLVEIIDGNCEHEAIRYLLDTLELKKSKRENERSKLRSTLRAIRRINRAGANNEGIEALCEVTEEWRD